MVPVMLLLTAVVQRISTPAFAKMQEDLGKVSGFQEETISGHKVIISNRRQRMGNREQTTSLAGGVFDVASQALSSLRRCSFR
jgi:ABC-type multidrug transport system fused ATPase/permease subunit